MEPTGELGKVGVVDSAEKKTWSWVKQVTTKKTWSWLEPDAAKKTLWPGRTGEDEGETEEHLGLGGTSRRGRAWTQEVIRKSITPD